jgi:hypothetical protein
MSEDDLAPELIDDIYSRRRKFPSPVYRDLGSERAQLIEQAASDEEYARINRIKPPPPKEVKYEQDEYMEELEETPVPKRIVGSKKPQIASKYIGQVVYRDKWVEVDGNEVCVNATEVRLQAERGATREKTVTRNYKAVVIDKLTGEKKKILVPQTRVINVHTPTAARDATGNIIEERRPVRICRIFSDQEKKCILEKASVPDKCELVKQTYVCVNDALINSYVSGVTGLDRQKIKECTQKLEEKGTVVRTGVFPLGEAAFQMPMATKLTGETLKLGGKEYVKDTAGGLHLKK